MQARPPTCAGSNVIRSACFTSTHYPLSSGRSSKASAEGGFRCLRLPPRKPGRIICSLIMSKMPLSIAVTGAAGSHRLFHLVPHCIRRVVGPDQPVILNLVDVPEALPALQGVVMELEDCACPALRKLTATADLNEGFHGINWALLIGSVSRKPGMERKDLLAINGKIFTGQAQALQKTPPRTFASLSWEIPAIPIASLPKATRRAFPPSAACDDPAGRKPLQGAIGKKGRGGHRLRFQSGSVGQSQPDHVPGFLSCQDRRPACDGGDSGTRTGSRPIL